MEAGIANFGDSQAAINLIHEMGKGTSLGRILGAGTETTGKVFGVRRVPIVKGQAIPAYDPRAVQGQGVTYATTTMGADHTAGYAVTANILGVGGNVDPLKPAGQVELSRNLQIATAFVDSTANVLVTPGGGFEGYTANIQYWANPTNAQEVWNIYKKGYKGNIFGNLFNTYSVQVSVTENGVTQGSVAL